MLIRSSSANNTIVDLFQHDGQIEKKLGRQTFDFIFSMFIFCRFLFLGDRKQVVTIGLDALEGAEAEGMGWRRFNNIVVESIQKLKT